MTTALAVVETMTGAELFKPGAIDPILDRIKAEVRAVQTDISTEEGRKACASLAYKVAKSKTFLDGVRKSLVEDEKKRLRLIDQEGSRIWDELESLQKEVRQPLTDWENAEKSRVAAHEANLAELVNAGTYSLQNWQMLPAEAMHDRLKEITSSTYEWDEFLQRARAAVVTTIAQIKEAIALREKSDADAAELTKLRAEQAKREQQEREDRIAREAKESAEAAARKRESDAALAAETERKRLEYQALESEAKAKAAEAREVEAAKKAEADKLAAVEAERVRAEAAQAKERADAARREENRVHAGKINREVRDALVTHSKIEGAHATLSPAQAQWVVKAIASNLIPHTKISY